MAEGSERPPQGFGWWKYVTTNRAGSHRGLM
jgi:hypothetical protein